MFPTRRITLGGDKFRDEYSLSFDGTNDYIENASPSGLPNGDSFTITAWIKCSSSDAGENWGIWRRDEATNNPIFRLSGTSRKINLLKHGTGESRL